MREGMYVQNENEYTKRARGRALASSYTIGEMS
jgi:hypothetical protein